MISILRLVRQASRPVFNLLGAPYRLIQSFDSSRFSACMAPAKRNKKVSKLVDVPMPKIVKRNHPMATSGDGARAKYIKRKFIARLQTLLEIDPDALADQVAGVDITDKKMEQNTSRIYPDRATTQTHYQHQPHQENLVVIDQQMDGRPHGQFSRYPDPAINVPTQKMSSPTLASTQVRDPSIDELTQRMSSQTFALTRVQDPAVNELTGRWSSQTFTLTRALDPAVDELTHKLSAPAPAPDPIKTYIEVRFRPRGSSVSLCRIHETQVLQTEDLDALWRRIKAEHRQFIMFSDIKNMQLTRWRFNIRAGQGFAVTNENTWLKEVNVKGGGAKRVFDEFIEECQKVGKDVAMINQVTAEMAEMAEMGHSASNSTDKIDSSETIVRGRINVLFGAIEYEA